jgi:NET1-associated nuclear protein 1 (U3 small nucleolar RNA-associated protein 17)
VSTNSELYALYTASNDVLLVNALSMKLERRLQGVQYSAKENVWLPKSGLVVDPLQGTLVMNGQPGTLQFFDSRRGAHVRSLTVQVDYAARNRNIPSADTRVDHIAFLPSDHSLVTVDRRHLFGSRASEEAHLRFWHRDLISKQCFLDTEVATPHKQTIHAVVTHPFEPWVGVCVCVSE